MIDNNLIQFWISELAKLQGISMGADELVDDVVLTAYVFDDPKTFSIVMTNVVNAFQLIVQQPTIGQALVGGKSGWNSFHFQSKRTQKHDADMRMVYRHTGHTILIMGFGNRFLPNDFYQRLKNRE